MSKPCTDTTSSAYDFVHRCALNKCSSALCLLLMSLILTLLSLPVCLSTEVIALKLSFCLCGCQKLLCIFSAYSSLSLSKGNGADIYSSVTLHPSVWLPVLLESSLLMSKIDQFAPVASCSFVRFCCPLPPFIVAFSVKLSRISERHLCALNMEWRCLGILKQTVSRTV